MSLNTGARTTPQDPDFDIRIRLRSDHFDLVTGMLGYTSEKDRASFINLTYRQLRRARDGNVGPRFVASTLRALELHRSLFAEKGIPVTFEALFETTSSERAA